MPYFQPFKASTGAKTPSFITAEIGQAEADNADAARIQEIRAQNQAGLTGAYEVGTSKMEKDPIAEGLRKGWDKMTGPDTSELMTPNSGTLTGGVDESAPWLESFDVNGAGQGQLGAPTAGAPVGPDLGSAEVMDMASQFGTTGDTAASLNAMNLGQAQGAAAGVEGLASAEAAAMASELGASATAAGIGEGAAATGGAASAAGGGGLMAGLGTAMPWLGAAAAIYGLLNQ